MAIRTVQVRKKISDFPDIPLDMSCLDSVMQEMLSGVMRESGKKKQSVRAFFPGKCDLEISDGSVSISAFDRKSMDMEKLLKEVTLLLQQKHCLPRYQTQMAINFRHGKHSIQFRSGHLKISHENELMPMYEVLNSSDPTMVRTLKTLKSSDIESTLADELSSYSLQSSNVALGFFKEAKEAILEGGSRKEAARKFGFKVIAKKSEGKIPNGQEEQTCIAERLCVHAEEYKSEDVVDKVIETYRMAKKVSRNPSVIMGLKDRVEVHADKKVVTISRRCGDSGIFSEFFIKLLEIIGVADIRALTFEYQKTVCIEDSPLRKWMNFQVKRFVDWTDTYQHSINFLAIAISVPVLFALLLRVTTLFEASMIMVPPLAIIAFTSLFSGKDKIIKKVGQGRVIFAFYLAYVISAIIAFDSFDNYLWVLGAIAAIVVAIIACIYIEIETEDKRKEAIKKARIWITETDKNLGIKLSALSKKALANKNFVNAMSVLVIIAGVVATLVIGAALIPVFVVVVISVPIFVILDNQFWQEIKADRERTLDKFFQDFREKREDLPEACEVRFEITKCKKLRNPFRGIPAKLAIYATKKYPKCLTLNKLKQTVQKLITGKWAEKTLRSEH